MPQFRTFIKAYSGKVFSQEVAGRDNTERRRGQILLDRFRLLGSQDSPGIKQIEIGMSGQRLRQKNGNN